MCHWAAERERNSCGVVEAAEKAAGGVMLGEDGKQLQPRTLLSWLHEYVEAGGRITPSRRGAHAKTESFLDDVDLKKDATEWLRANVQARRKKPTNNEHPVPPLTVARFHKWVNETLLKETLEADSRRKPICERTACRWLHVRLAQP